MSSDTVFELLRACQRGEAGSVVGRDLDSSPRLDPLYVSTEEDRELREIFVEEYDTDGKLVILTGSAGDGKSALLSKAYREAKDAGIGVTDEDMHLDATGSSYLQRSYRHDLSEFLDDAVAGFNDEEAHRKGLAINYGLAIDFFEQGDGGLSDGYEEIWNALEAAESQRKVGTDEGFPNVVVINLGHRDLFAIEPDRFGEGPLQELVDHFDVSDPESPLAELLDPEAGDCPATGRCPLHHNLEQLTDEEIRTRLTRLVAGSCIIRELYINPRSILDQLSRTLLHPEFRTLRTNGSSCAVGVAIVDGEVTPRAEHLFCNRVIEVFSGEESGRFVDPVAQVSREIDSTALSLEADSDALQKATRRTPLRDDEWDPTARIRTAIRRKYLRGELGETHIDDETFETFLAGLSFFHGNDDAKTGGKEIIQTSVEALQNWSGRSTDSDRMAFVDGQRSPEYRFTAQWNEPHPNVTRSRKDTQKQTRPGQLRLYFDPPNDGRPVFVPLGYRLYHLMTRIRQGYNPSSSDVERSQGVRLLYSQLSQFTQKYDTVRIEDKTGEPLFEVSRGALDSIEVDEVSN